MPRLLPLALVAALGCDPAIPAARTPATRPTAPDDHDHGPGPHGGTVIELGKWHGEFVVDHATKEATVYVLSGNLKRDVAVAADALTLSLKDPKVQVTLKAAPREADPAGKASRFVGTHDALGVEREFSGTVGGVIDGTPYAGDFAETPHGHKHK